MIKKSLLFLFILFFSLGIFVKEALALNPPENIRTITVGEGSAKLGWTFPPTTGGAGSGTIQRFVLSFRIVGEVSWSKRYPSTNGPNYEYMLMGLTENTNYEWTIMAEATDPTYNSAEVPDPPATFTTLAGGVDGGNGGGNGGNGGGPVGLTNPLEAETLEEAINALINFLFLLAFTLGPLLIIYAAFLILSAAGREEQIRKGKNIILWTLVALTIILLAKGLPSIIKGALGG